MKTTLIALACLVVPAAFFTASAPASQPSQPPVAESWTIDNGHSSVLFRIHHAKSGMFYGRFNKIAGSLTIDPAKPEASSIKFEIDAASVDTNDDKRDEHLRSPDFFSVKEFPSVRFASTSVKKTASGLEVTGDLEMHGKKKSVTAEVAHTGTGEFMGMRTGYEATLTIKRSEFGMTGYIDNGALSDEVKLIVSLEAVKG